MATNPSWKVEPTSKTRIIETTTYRKEIGGALYVIQDTIGYRKGAVLIDANPIPAYDKSYREQGDECNLHFSKSSILHQDLSEVVWEGRTGTSELPPSELALLKEKSNLEDAGWFKKDHKVSFFGPLQITAL